MNRHAKLVFAVLAATLLASCAAFQPDQTYKPMDLSGQNLARRADNFLIVMDTSQSMDTVPEFNGKSDLRREWDIVTAINQSMPDAGFVATLCTAGGGGVPISKRIQVVYGPALWDRELFQQSLEDVNKAYGSAYLAKCLNKNVETLSYTSGTIALIVLTDGATQLDDPVVAAKALKAAYGDRICISAVQIGNEPGAREMLSKVVEEGGCGILVDEKVFATQEGTDAFIKRVFFQDEARKPTLKCAPAAPAPAVAPPSAVSEKTLAEPVTGKKPTLKKRSKKK